MEPLAAGLHAEVVDELPEYRSVSATAIIGLLVALFSPLALVRTVLIVIPVAAVVLCVVALARIREADGKRIGKTPALIGLGLACLFAAAAPAQIIAYNRELHARAQPIAIAWLETLQRGQPHKAHQLTKPDAGRLPQSDEVLWPHYASDEAAGRELKEFVEHPAIRFILSVGADARIRFYEPHAVVRMSSTSQLVSQRYAVTYDDPSAGRTTFFVTVEVERRDPGANSGEQWRILDFAAGTSPASV